MKREKERLLAVVDRLTNPQPEIVEIEIRVDAPGSGWDDLLIKTMKARGYDLRALREKTLPVMGMPRALYFEFRRQSSPQL